MSRRLLATVVGVLVCSVLCSCSKPRPEEIPACVEFKDELEKVKEMSGELLVIAKEAPVDVKELLQMRLDGGNVMQEYWPLLDKMTEGSEVNCKKALAGGGWRWNNNAEAIVDWIYLASIPLLEDRYIYMKALVRYANDLEQPEMAAELLGYLNEYVEDMKPLKEYCQIDVNEEACKPFFDELDRVLELP